MGVLRSPVVWIHVNSVIVDKDIDSFWDDKPLNCASFHAVSVYCPERYFSVKLLPNRDFLMCGIFANVGSFAYLEAGV